MFFLFKLIIGLILRIVSYFVRKKENMWIFGASYGTRFVENSKYFYLYVSTQNQENCIWVAKSKELVDELNSNGIHAVYNYSFEGLLTILKAKYYVFSTSRNDIDFFFKRETAVIINLFHGMPIKKIVKDFSRKISPSERIINNLNDLFVVGFTWEQIDYSISTSSFFTPFLTTAFNSKEILETGLPRNDLFFKFDPSVKIHKIFDGKKVITYMPTHRKYGMGLKNPAIFSNNEELLEYFRKNNIVIVYKLHVNMLKPGYQSEIKSDVIIDLSVAKIDPQELLADTDLLITDYSSCFVDYLLLKRPILFYHYDDYEVSDNPVYFKIKDYFSDLICTSETELEKKIKSSLLEFDAIVNKNSLDLFHKNQSGGFSKAIYTSIKEKRLNEF